MVNKKFWVIALVLLSLFAVGTLFAGNVLACRDPSDGTINVTFMGDTVSAVYGGKSAQTFQVVVLLNDGTTQYLTFRFPAVKKEQSRRQNQNARGKIAKITQCDLTTEY